MVSGDWRLAAGNLKLATGILLIYYLTIRQLTDLSIVETSLMNISITAERVN